MSEISPAPWTSHGPFVYDNDGLIIGEFGGKKECANARLSASAPKMLHELKDLIHQIKNAQLTGQGVFVFKTDTAEAVVAEAEGSAK